MRISSLQMFNVARNSMAGANKEIMRTQEQMSEGKRVLTPSDDPVAATKILQLTDELANIDQYLKNIDIGKNNLNMEEGDSRRCGECNSAHTGNRCGSREHRRADGQGI
ncbi:MAG: hypothetical protein NVV73_20535 [Cellvibrionaceae bacterium]|nr:hypothetical protein [Cellvibrionaceae bacterium]